MTILSIVGRRCRRVQLVVAPARFGLAFVLGAGALADSAGIVFAATVLSTVATALVLLSTVAIARTPSHRHASNRKEKLWSSS